MKIGFFNILTLIFVIAKLAGLIAWSWTVVLLPTIVAAALGLFILLLLVVAAIAIGKE